MLRCVGVEKHQV